MTDNDPCTIDAALWNIGSTCAVCQHSSWFHPGGGAGQFRQCMICNLGNLESALITRESNLARMEAKLEALKHELEYELMRVKALTDGYPTYARTETMVNTMAYGEMIIP